jgi:hypothetical protein
MMLRDFGPPDGLPFGCKWYFRSGSFTMTLHDPLGAIHAALTFVGRAIETGRVHQLGEFIDASEDGLAITFRRETTLFLRNKFGLGGPMLNALIAQELAGNA